MTAAVRLSAFLYIETMERDKCVRQAVKFGYEPCSAHLDPETIISKSEEFVNIMLSEIDRKFCRGTAFPRKMSVSWINRSFMELAHTPKNPLPSLTEGEFLTGHGGGGNRI